MKILVNLRKSCFDLTRGRSLLTGADLEKYLWGGEGGMETLGVGSADLVANNHIYRKAHK